MNRKMLLLTIAVSLIALGLLLTVLDTYSQEQDPDQVSGSETAFSYQGYLTSGEASAEGPFDFSFALYGAEAGLPQVGPTIPMDDVDVSEGQFAVHLDFGDVFDGQPLWLEIGVSPDIGSESYTILTPRHGLGSTPYASYAYRSSWVGLADIPPDLADGDDNDDSLAALSCGLGEIPEWDGSIWDCAADDDSWALMTCPDDKILRRSGSDWVCDDDRDSDTTYSAGAGLELDGASFAISPTYQLPQSCISGQIAEWNGLHWECGKDDVGTGGGGEITGVFGGDGLSGGGESGTLTVHAGEGTGIVAGADAISITIPYRLPQSCETGDVAQWNDSSSQWDCDPDGDLLAQMSCSEGEVLKWDQLSTAWKCALDTDTTDDTVSYLEIVGIVDTTAGSVAAGDHGHDGTFLTQSDLITGTATVAWSHVISVPVELADGDNDTLAGLGCDPDEIVRQTDSGWMCDGDRDNDTTYSAGEGLLLTGTNFSISTTYTLPQWCDPGHIAEWNGVYWDCSIDDIGEGGGGGTITGVYGGDGLFGQGSSGSVTIHAGAGDGLQANEDDLAIETSYQLPQICNEGWVPHWNEGSLAWDCEPDSDILAYLGCDEGQIPKWSPDFGGWYCAEDLADDFVTYIEIADIVGNGPDMVADGEHDHDLIYYPQNDLYTPYSGASVAWENLVNVPAGLGVYSDTLATLDCIGGQVAKWDESLGQWLCDADFDGLGNLICSPGEIPQFDGSIWSCVANGNGWSLNGNSGTVYGTNFLGTTDDISLTLAVNSMGALRLEPTTWTPNLIGGSAANTVQSGVYGASIGGGASPIEPHAISEHFGTIGGGTDNTVGNADTNPDDGRYGTIGGGAANTVSSVAATVGGGVGNTASNVYATVAGGITNQASGYMSAVGGGSSNIAGQYQSTVAGGLSNLALGNQATIGGGESNRIITTTQRATIAGGFTNEVTGDYGSIGGGNRNSVTGTYGTIAGGEANQIMTTAERATISGGGYNAITGTYGTIGGGYQHRVTGAYSTVGGGRHNTIYSDTSFIGGGYYNWAFAMLSTVGGGTSNAAYGTHSFIGGGYSNQGDGDYGAIAGGHSNIAGTYAAVGGGFLNFANGQASHVGGGNTNKAQATYAAVSGGHWNNVIADSGAISGGENNNVSASYGAIGGGQDNSVIDNFGTVGGGDYNTAGGQTSARSDAAYATVGGGENNSAVGPYSTIGGGLNNMASFSGTVAGGELNLAGAPWATVGGGYFNYGTGSSSTIAGGYDNSTERIYGTVAGGYSNQVVGDSGTIGGGYDNYIGGAYGTVPGGYENGANGAYSFAAGSYAQATHDGSFVWSDSYTTTYVNSGRDHQFKVRAYGGALFEKDETDWINMFGNIPINTSTGAFLSSGGAWTSSSDRNAKENFTDVDGQEILAALADVPITTWNYKAEDDEVRHIGPVAQDLYAAFSMGDSETAIGMIDADGLALASIQALYERSQTLEAENVQLEQQLSDLEGRLAAVENGTSANQPALNLYIMFGFLVLLMLFVGWLVIRLGLFNRGEEGEGGGS